MLDWSVGDVRITSHRKLLYLLYGCAGYLVPVDSSIFYCRCNSIGAQMSWSLVTSQSYVSTNWCSNRHILCITMCKKNTNQITDINTLQFIWKLRNSSMQSHGEPSQYLPLVLDGYAGRYLTTSGSSWFQKFESGTSLIYCENHCDIQFGRGLRFYRSTQFPVLHKMVEWISAYRLSNDGGYRW